MKTSNPVTRATLGIMALLAIVILANWLVSLTPSASRGIDFTEKNIHTLSDGTKAILGELDTPVVIRYYATRSTDFMPEHMKLHMRRVDDLLKEYASLSGGSLRIEHLDPEPDTEAEDSARLDGIVGTRINDQNLYFGLAVSCIEQTRVIPFLDPNQETMLEYELSSRIAEVSATNKPKVGVMSGLNIKGNTGNPMMGQQPAPPWVIYQQITQGFDVVDIPMDQPKIDADEISALLLFHPASISPATEFAIDQYLLQGGTVIACLDAFSVTAERLGGGNPMMGGGTPTTSTLPNLLRGWGVEFESGMTLADPAYKTKFSDGATGLAVLSLPSEAMPQKDSVITRDLGSIILFLPGAFIKKDSCKLGMETLVQSSARAGFVDTMKASRLETEAKDVKSSGKPYPLVTRLHGKFPSAFPKGDPKPKLPKAGSKDEHKKPKPALKESTAKGNVFLIADTDAFYDQFAYSFRQIGSVRMAEALNGNPSLLLNLLDHAVGSKHLIGSRSRAAVSRPFTVIKEMEDNFDKVAGDRRSELEEKERAAQQRYNDLNTQLTRGNQISLEQAKEKERQKYAAEISKYRKEIRELEKGLRRQKDELTGRITLLNVAIMPAFVILAGLGVFFQRRSSTRAR